MIVNGQINISDKPHTTYKRHTLNDLNPPVEISFKNAISTVIQENTPIPVKKNPKTIGKMSFPDNMRMDPRVHNPQVIPIVIFLPLLSANVINPNKPSIDPIKTAALAHSLIYRLSQYKLKVSVTD